MRNLSLLAPLVATAALSASFAAAPASIPTSPRPETCPLAGLAAARVPGSPAAAVAVDERAALRAAEARASGLETMRGGEIVLSDSDVQLILITAAVVIVLILVF